MIINVRGTSGAGKSTIVRAVLESFKMKTNMYVDGKKRPRGYICHTPDNQRDLFILGHYEILCGGGDTISDMNEQFDFIRRADESGQNVLCEGLFMSGESKQFMEMHDDNMELLILGIKRSFTSCYRDANARKRRLAKMRGQKYKGDYKESGVKGKHKGTQSAMRKMKEHGIQCEWHYRDACLNRIKEELEL